MEANKSFYQYWLLMGGISFGIADLNYLKHGEIADVRVIFPTIISVGFLVLLLLKKHKLETRGERTVTLAKRVRHICADYLCIVGTTSLFSMLAYTVLNDLTLATGWYLSRVSLVILINSIIFAAGMSILSGLASDERRMVQR